MIIILSVHVVVSFLLHRAISLVTSLYVNILVGVFVVIILKTLQFHGNLKRAWLITECCFQLNKELDTPLCILITIATDKQVCQFSILVKAIILASYAFIIIKKLFSMIL